MKSLSDLLLLIPQGIDDLEKRGPEALARSNREADEQLNAIIAGEKGSVLGAAFRATATARANVTASGTNDDEEEEDYDEEEDDDEAAADEEMEEEDEDEEADEEADENLRPGGSPTPTRAATSRAFGKRHQAV